MGDSTGLVALVVAAVALVVAAGQLTQQLMATAYVIRKCDRIVTGGLSKGGKRRWHWRQFRFTVSYQSIAFTLPPKLYTALGLNATVQVDTPAKEVYDVAKKTQQRRGPGQACWVSLIQDLVQYGLLETENICLKEESADRVPEDLTVAPTRVDAITILLSSVATGMQVFKYSPTSGEVTLGGGTGSISSSLHPVLGGLLHYSVFSDHPAIGLEKARMHSRALRNEQGVWANAVFGLFRDRSYRPDFLPLQTHLARRIPILQHWGWPNDSVTDTIGGAACFLSFGDVDCYISVPPSVSKRWCAHFAEAILKFEHWDMMQALAKNSETGFIPAAVEKAMDDEEHENIETRGFSSPHTARIGQTFVGKTWLDMASPEVDARKLLLSPGLVTALQPFQEKYGALTNSFKADLEDPSSYIPCEVAWEQIQRLDQILATVSRRTKSVEPLSSGIAARALIGLAEVGAPSWGTQEFGNFFETWRTDFDLAVSHVLNESTTYLPKDVDRQASKYHAHFRILRAAYMTIMMRSAQDIGPGLTESSTLETALLYMA